MQCQSPYHQQVVSYRSFFRKYLPRTRGYSTRLPNLTPGQAKITLSLVIFDDGVEVGRFAPYSACAFCWSVLLNALGLKPKDLAEIAPEQAKALFREGYKWVNAVKEGRAVKKKWSILERDLRLAREATLETLRQLGILKDPKTPP